MCKCVMTTSSQEAGDETQENKQKLSEVLDSTYFFVQKKFWIIGVVYIVLMIATAIAL